ncbi:MAG: cytochrome oxidase putative small subunit CydP [Rhizomicrobium sp.]
MILARRRLGLEIGALLAAKLVLLAALYFLFFSQHAPNGPAATGAHIMGVR